MNATNSAPAGAKFMTGQIHAVLGPTNTGKTHYALSRMMAHCSGMIGFPLRLLARENYERLVSIKGEKFVALLTGEEKIIPPKARWFSCTVEAMPLDRKVDFLAIDEIQLSADPERGHIFTDRLLHARGKEETLFLGAETIRPLLRRLVSNIQIETRPRLSQLCYRSFSNLNRLPPRSAIVAFSAHNVYALAEAIRQKRGGCAIIMGRLSPHARNAQIALYQNRDVDYLVATDAIGMGLNMDVDHVALADLKKFDGQTPRILTAQEVAQITGRAGRGMKDGSFGTVSTCPAMSQNLIHQVENHQFPPLKHLYWRQSRLDYTTPKTLLYSLMNRPPYPELTMGRMASDVEILQNLITFPEILDRAKGRQVTSLLWDICQIPDFRKLSDGSHTRLCGRIFTEIAQYGHLPSQWIDGQLKGLDRVEGDIDTLMQRLSGVRVCSYISARTGWIHNNFHWQARCQDVEERLSDALHDRLTSRFVNRQAAVLLRRPTDMVSQDKLYAVTAEDRIMVEGHEIGKISGFRLARNLTDHTPETALLYRAGQRALRQSMTHRIGTFLKEAPASLHLSAEGFILWRDAPIARLIQGKDFFIPSLRLLPGEFHDTQQSQRVLSVLSTYLETTLSREFRQFFQACTILGHEQAFRGLIHRLREDGGTTPVLVQDQKFDHKQRHILKRNGIIIGQDYCYVPFLLKSGPLARLCLLAGLKTQSRSTEINNSENISSLWEDLLKATLHGRLSIMQKTSPARKNSFSAGWINRGRFWIRVDRFEHVLTLISQKSEMLRPVPPYLASLLGIGKQHVEAFLKSINITCKMPRPASAQYYGPPAPLLLRPALSPSRRTKKTNRNSKTVYSSIRIRPDSPFASLVWLNEKKGTRPKNKTDSYV